MRFEGTVDIAAPRDRVWAYLTDPAQVSRCAPDLQRVDIIDSEHFTLIARAGVGPIRATFTIRTTFTELRAPEHAAIAAHGDAPGSTVDMESWIDLAESAPDRTRMRWSSEVKVSGMIAGVGGRMLQVAADKTTRQIFECMKSALDN